MQSLTGYKSGAAVGATVTPAVVTAGKTLRIQTAIITYVAAGTLGSVMFRLRANTAGVGIITSPLVATFCLGTTIATAGVQVTQQFNIPDGLEFAAGTGIAVGMLGLDATQVAANMGYASITLLGYEF